MELLEEFFRARCGCAGVVDVHIKTAFWKSMLNTECKLGGLQNS